MRIQTLKNSRIAAFKIQLLNVQPFLEEPLVHKILPLRFVKDNIYVNSS